MRWWKWVQVCLIVLILALLFLITLISTKWLLYAGISLSILLIYGIERQFAKAELNRQFEEKYLSARNDLQLQAIQTISLFRHDWLNDMQIFTGYAQLKKYEHLPPFVEKIKHKVQMENNICKLGIPSLVIYLLSFGVDCRSIELEVELAREVDLNQATRDGMRAAHLIEETIETFKAAAEHSAEEAEEPRKLNLSFEFPNDSLQLVITYSSLYGADVLNKRLLEIAERFTALNVIKNYDLKQDNESLKMVMQLHN